MQGHSLFLVLIWISIPTVMNGGYALPGLLTRAGQTPAEVLPEPALIYGLII